MSDMLDIESGDDGHSHIVDALSDCFVKLYMGEKPDYLEFTHSEYNSRRMIHFMVESGNRFDVSLQAMINAFGFKDERRMAKWLNRWYRTDTQIMDRLFRRIRRLNSERGVV